MRQPSWWILGAWLIAGTVGVAAAMAQPKPDTPATAGNGPGPSASMGWDDPQGPPRGPLKPEEVREAIEVLKQVDPEAAQAVEQLREESPHRVGFALFRRFPQIREFLALRQHDPAMYDLRVRDLQLAHESRRLADRIAQARQGDDDDAARRLVAELEPKVRQHFDIRQQIRERELANLEAMVIRLREQLEQRADNRDDLIEQRLDELTTGHAADW